MCPHIAEMPMAATALSPAPCSRAAVAGTYALSASRASTAAPAFQPTLRATLDEPGLAVAEVLEPLAGERPGDELAGRDAAGGEARAEAGQRVQRAAAPLAAAAHLPAALRSSSR